MAKVSVNLVELLGIIICIYDQSLTYLVTIYIGSAMDWFCEMISESWNTVNTFPVATTSHV